MAADAQNLASKITASGGPVSMLRNLQTGRYVFPVPPEHSNWRDEQAWNKTATLFDQSFHMWDVYFKGPDVRRLLLDVTANNYTNFDKNRAKQLIAVNSDGYLIGDAVLFALEDDEVNVVGTEYAMNWMTYLVEKDGYDVEITRDDALVVNKTGRRLTFRYQIQGPR